MRARPRTISRNTVERLALYFARMPWLALLEWAQSGMMPNAPYTRAAVRVARRERALREREAQ